MREFTIQLPLTYSVICTVEAESYDDALDKILDRDADIIEVIRELEYIGTEDAELLDSLDLGSNGDDLDSDESLNELDFPHSIRSLKDV